MDQGDDVERLFSWLKTPDLRYREFAGEREVADAVANWPALRRAAAETVRIEEEEEEAGTPPPIIEERGLPEPPPRPVPPLVQPPYERPPPSFQAGEATGEAPWAQPAPPPAPVQPPRREPPRFTAPPPEPRRVSPGRETLFGGTYRGFEERDRGGEEREEAPREPSAPGEEASDRALDAVFSRLSHPARRYREERPRTSGNPGLGPVFRRLR
ncbi:MAG TPA: hypothetical protein VND87_03060 [Stellaceae bacterium]|nr:hypothetical protein [Stellaceae bacterium]